MNSREHSDNAASVGSYIPVKYEYPKRCVFFRERDQALRYLGIKPGLGIDQSCRRVYGVQGRFPPHIIDAVQKAEEAGGLGVEIYEFYTPHDQGHKTIGCILCLTDGSKDMGYYVAVNAAGYCNKAV